MRHRHLGRLEDRGTKLVEHRILVARNGPVHALDFGGIAVVAQIFLQYLLQQAFLVVVIVYRKIAVVPGTTKCLERLARVEAFLEQAQAHGMECSHPRKAQRGIEQLLDTRGHLAGSLVRERHCQDPVGFHVMVRHQVRNLVRDGTGLSRTRTRQNQHRAFNFLRGSRLFRIQLAIQHTRIDNTCH